MSKKHQAETSNSNLPMTTRRSALAGALTVAQASLAASIVGVSNAHAQAPDAKDMANNEVFLRVHGSGTPEPSMWWYTGKLWGKNPYDMAVQLFAVEGMSFVREVASADGSFDAKMDEVGFWKDPSSGVLLDSWTNPMNGLLCEAKHYRSSTNSSFDAEGKFNRLGQSDRPSAILNGSIGPAIWSGNSVWTSETIVGRINNQKQAGQGQLEYVGPVITATSLATYSANASDVLDQTQAWVPATFNYQTMGGWYPWMQMGQAPGQISFQLVGRKLQSAKEIPNSLSSLIHERRPGFLENPKI